MFINRANNSSVIFIFANSFVYAYRKVYVKNLLMCHHFKIGALRYDSKWSSDFFFSYCITSNCVAIKSLFDLAKSKQLSLEILAPRNDYNILDLSLLYCQFRCFVQLFGYFTSFLFTHKNVEKFRYYETSTLGNPKNVLYLCKWYEWLPIVDGQNYQNIDNVK